MAALDEYNQVKPKPIPSIQTTGGMFNLCCYSTARSNQMGKWHHTSNLVLISDVSSIVMASVGVPVCVMYSFRMDNGCMVNGLLLLQQMVSNAHALVMLLLWSRDNYGVTELRNQGGNRSSPSRGNQITFFPPSLFLFSSLCRQLGPENSNHYLVWSSLVNLASSEAN